MIMYRRGGGLNPYNINILKKDNRDKMAKSRNELSFQNGGDIGSDFIKRLLMKYKKWR